MTKISYSLIFLAASAVAAQAHPGDHGFVTVVQGLFHLVTEPDHLAMIAAGALVVAGGIWYKRRSA